MDFLGAEFIALGAWNKVIIGEVWLKKTCKNLDSESIKFTTEVDLGVSQIIYKASFFEIKISDKILTIFSSNDQAISEIESMSKSILATLPETPLIALGVNFDFNLDKKQFSNIDDIFKNKALGEFKLCRFQASKKSENFSMNLIFDDLNSVLKVRVNFNFAGEQIKGFDKFSNYNELYRTAKEALKNGYK